MSITSKFVIKKALPTVQLFSVKTLRASASSAARFNFSERDIVFHQLSEAFNVYRKAAFEGLINCSNFFYRLILDQ